MFLVCFIVFFKTLVLSLIQIPVVTGRLDWLAVKTGGVNQAYNFLIAPIWPTVNHKMVSLLF